MSKSKLDELIGSMEYHLTEDSENPTEAQVAFLKQGMEIVQSIIRVAKEETAEKEWRSVERLLFKGTLRNAFWTRSVNGGDYFIDVSGYRVSGKTPKETVAKAAKFVGVKIDD